MCVFVRSAGCTSSAPLRLSFARLTNHHPVHLSAFRAGVELSHFLWEVKELAFADCCYPLWTVRILYGTESASKQRRLSCTDTLTWIKSQGPSNKKSPALGGALRWFSESLYIGRQFHTAQTRPTMRTAGRSSSAVRSSGAASALTICLPVRLKVIRFKTSTPPTSRQ